MKAQRMRSAKFVWVRAPMISAPMIPTRINPYIARAERRVKSHMSISKLRPRRVRERLLDLAAMLTSQRSLDDDENRKAIKGQEERPFHPDGFALVLEQSRPQVEDGDAQAIDGVAQRPE